MNRSLRLRTLSLVALLTLCVLYLLPTFIGDSLPSWYYFDKRINLGLDLKGGAHFVYSIDLDKAVDDKAVEIKRDIETKLEEKGITATVSTPSVAPGALTIKLADAAKKAEVEQLVNSEYKGTVSSRTWLLAKAPLALMFSAPMPAPRVWLVTAPFQSSA